MKTNQHLLTEAYKKAGGMPEVFSNREMAHLMIHGDEVYSSHLIPGLDLDVQTNGGVVEVYFRMHQGQVFNHPVNICFGIVPEKGKQEIKVDGEIEEDAKLEFLAYCVFPNAIKVEHFMNGRVNIRANSSFHYTEVHYHGDNGGILVKPKVTVSVGENSIYQGNFYLTKGRAGQVDIDFEISTETAGKVDLLAKINASGDDNVRIRESAILKGTNSKGLVRSRIVGRGSSRSEVISEIIALNAGCYGHVDCIETLLEQATAKAIPLVDVQHRLATVTHEAAVGRVNKKQLETIMAKGLSEDEAIEILVGGLLR